MKWISSLLFYVLLCSLSLTAEAQLRFTIVQLNAENLFDTKNDSLKQDDEFLPSAMRHWTSQRYWKKLNNIGKVILSSGKDDNRWVIPDLVGLCEVETDSVLYDLTKRSLLRKARYEYVITRSPDERGINVALLYSPFSFRKLHSHSVRVSALKGYKPTRDILYVKGEIENGDSLHVLVVHAPSKSGGELATRPHRIHVMKRIGEVIDSIKRTELSPRIVLMGDLNDSPASVPLESLYQHGLINASKDAIGKHGAKGTYRYQGQWERIDHIFVSDNLKTNIKRCEINDSPFLLESDEKYGGVKPKRSYSGMKYTGGFSDHLPLVLNLVF